MLLTLLACAKTTPPATLPASDPLEAAVQADPSDLERALALADQYAEAGHHVFAILLAEHVFLSTEDDALRTRASATARASLQGNVHITEQGPLTTLVPSRMEAATMETLTDPDEPWDRRYEVAVAVGLYTLSQDGAFDTTELESLAQLRLTANQLAMKAQTTQPTHPLVAFEVRQGESGCGMGLNLQLLGYGTPELQAWLADHPRARQELTLCTQVGSWSVPASADLTRSSWGVPL